MSAGFTRRALPWMLAAVFLAAAALLFFNLGHYALWEDEAGSALNAQSVLETGDTRGWVGHNLVAYRHGLVLHNLRTEGEPPFCAYFDAPFLKLLGANAWGARLPFALCGLAAVALLLWWAWKWKAQPFTAAVFCLALLGNVPLFLYSRQCHYYAVAILLFTAAAYLHLHWGGDRRKLALLGGCLALLLAANYSFCVLLCLCLAADYAIWQRKARPLRGADWAILLGPPVATGLVLLAWWNPLRTSLGGYLGRDTLFQRLSLFFWHWRDLNHGEMFVGALMLLAPWAAFQARTPWLKRGLFALLLYAVAQTVLTTQTVADCTISDVRYFCGLLPLFAALGAFTFVALIERLGTNRWAAFVAALFVFGTNFFQGGMFYQYGFRSTLGAFVRELANPPPDPYTAAAGWINANVPEGASVWVAPNAMILPLIFHAPRAVYGWQLPRPPLGQFAALPPIFFEKSVPPDYVVAFGPSAKVAEQVLDELEGVSYQPVALLDVYWKDYYRPEIFWRTFEAIRGFDPERLGIHVFQRIDLPAPLKVEVAPAP